MRCLYRISSPGVDGLQPINPNIPKNIPKNIPNEMLFVPGIKPWGRRPKKPLPLIQQSTSIQQSTTLYHSTYSLSNVPPNIRRIDLTDGRLHGWLTVDSLA
eukprot:3140377-Pyramimonas_sp.AAC.1